MILSTPRLSIRELVDADAPVIVQLLNDPAFIRYVGDKGVRTLADARAYLESGPRAMYTEFGFGLWAVTLTDETPIGICGLLKRPVLDDRWTCLRRSIRRRLRVARDSRRTARDTFD